MKFWPQKKWKKALLVAFLMIVAVGVPIVAYLEYSVYREVTTTIDVKNPQGTKTALLIYHPGLTSFAHDVSYAFADGLAQNGWRVETATASQQAPVDLSRYSLLVLGWPIYDFNPGPTVANHLGRIGNPHGINTVVIAIAGGLDPLNAPSAMNHIVQNAKGTVLESLKAFKGGGTAVANMQEAASKILP